MATYVVVNKAFRGSQGLSLSYNKLVNKTLSFHAKNFGGQSSIDPYNPAASKHGNSGTVRNPKN
jgi:hypothetical protein